MSYETFRTAVLSGFLSGFQTVRPSFPVANIVFARSQDLPPPDEAYLQVIYAEQEGRYEAIGKAVTQTVLFTVDIYVPTGEDLLQVEQIADDVRETINWLILPNSGRKERLSKRDFGNTVSGYAQSRVSVRLIYDIRG